MVSSPLLLLRTPACQPPFGLKIVTATTYRNHASRGIPSLVFLGCIFLALSANAAAPKHVTGGRLHQAEDEGEEAARIAIRILRGEPASGFQPVILDPLPPRYDWRELQKWRIDEKLLPKGSTTLFRTPTLWQKYWGWILGCAAVFLVQALLIAALAGSRLRRRHAERSLRESEARFTLAAKAARMGWWELDIATGGMLGSAMLRELFDLEAGTAINPAILENRVHPGDRAARAAAIESAIRGQGEYKVKYRVVLQDQTARWLSERGRRMIDADGKPTRLLAVSLDITERNEAVQARKRAEEEAQRQREQINLLGRASLLGEMTASLAHELSQPLTAILANASAGVRFIDGGGTEPGNLREIFSEIGSGGRRASDIIQSVRNAIKRGDSMSRRIGINSVITNVALILQADAAAYSCTVQTLLTENLPLIEADPIQIQQVLINLVANAFHAMGNTPVARRRVEITTRLDVPGSIGVTVRDYGTGIAAEMQGRIFDQFYTTRQDGLGMGLAIVKSIIGAHGGRITVSNAGGGGGACFDFTLPVAAKSRP